MTAYMYLVFDVDKKNKVVTWTTCNFNDGDDDFFFFNYGASSKDKQVAMVILDEATDELPLLYMVGEKDSKKWSLCDAANGGKKTSVDITMPKSFSGYVFFQPTIKNTYIFGIDDCKTGTTTAGLAANGTISFKRDDAKTKTIMSWMCGTADECYYYEGQECEDFIADAFDTLILNKSYPQAKGWRHELVLTFFEDFAVREY